MKTIKKSVSIILALVLMLSVFASAALTSNAAESSKSPVGARVTDEVKANWEKLKKYLSECTDQKYSYYNKDTRLAIPAETYARMSLSDNRVEFYYSFEGESREITLTILEVDINTTSTVNGEISNYKTYGSDQYYFWGDYSVGLENCNSPSEYTVSNAGGHSYAKNGVALSPAPDYHATNEEYKEVFSDYAKEIEKLLLKPALNFTLEDLGFGIPALPEPETTEPQTDSEETTAAETTEPQTVSEETTAPVETAEPQETTVPAETTEPQETTAPQETTEPQETTVPQGTTSPQETTVPQETTIPQETTEPQEATAPSGKTVKLNYLPAKRLIAEGDTVKLIIQDKTGEFHVFDMTETPLVFDGVKVYTVTVSADIEPELVQFQIYSGKTCVGETTLTSAQYEKSKGKIITFNGSIHGESEQPSTEPQATQAPAQKAKEANPIKVSVKAKTVKLKKLKKKNQTVKAITVKNAEGKVTYKITSASKKIKKLVKISSKGVITVKKWKKAKKGTYKIKVKITAKGNTNYSAKTVSKMVKFNVK